MLATRSDGGGGFSPAPRSFFLSLTSPRHLGGPRAYQHPNALRELPFYFYFSPVMGFFGRMDVLVDDTEGAWLNDRINILFLLIACIIYGECFD